MPIPLISRLVSFVLQWNYRNSVIMGRFLWAILLHRMHWVDSLLAVWVSREHMNINRCITSENWHMWKICKWATLHVGWRSSATSVNLPAAIRWSLMFYVRVKNHAAGANAPHSAYRTFWRTLLMLHYGCWDDNRRTKTFFNRSQIPHCLVFQQKALIQDTCA